MPMVGGLSVSQAPTEEDLKVLLPVLRTYICQQTGKNSCDLKILSVSRQVVAGTNYFAKVEHDGNFWHVRVFQALPAHGGEVTVHSHKVTTAEEPLTYF